jgi:hypothetical protein
MVIFHSYVSLPYGKPNVSTAERPTMAYTTPRLQPDGQVEVVVTVDGKVGRIQQDLTIKSTLW